MSLVPAELSPSTYQASDYGLLCMSYDPAASTNTGTSLTPAGTIFTIRLYLPRRALVSNICIYLTTNGGTLTANQCGAALYNSSGTLLSNTAMTQSTTWNSTGFKSMALLSAQDCAAGFYDVALFYNGTSGPGPLRTGAIAGNLNLSGSSIRNATADTGRTTSFPATLGAKTASAIAYWAALS